MPKWLRPSLPQSNTGAGLVHRMGKSSSQGILSQAFPAIELSQGAFRKPTEVPWDDSVVRRVGLLFVSHMIRLSKRLMV
jgi:hypothetical protein